MKIQLIISILVTTVISCTSIKSTVKYEQKKYKNLPLIKANNEITDYRIGDNWIYGEWYIAPEVENDTLEITCFSSTEHFLFKTDIDSIKFEIKPETTKRFYILLNDSLYAHTIVKGSAFQPQIIDFELEAENEEIQIVYPNGEGTYLSNLRKAYPLTNIVNEAENDLEKVLHVLNWTNTRWKHNGNNTLKKNDAISILKEAEKGGSFPCFAYAIVLRDQLNALGFKARTVYLKTKDAKNRKYSPGHVATEVYLNDLEKWIFLDGQFNVIPTLNDVPLNAIEFQNAISENYNEFMLLSKNGVSKRNYVEFVYDYLFYIDTNLDQRHDIDQRKKINGKKSIMLVPKGAENLSRVDFWNMDIDYCIYTNSIKDFYKSPD